MRWWQGAQKALLEAASARFISILLPLQSCQPGLPSETHSGLSSLWGELWCQPLVLPHIRSAFCSLERASLSHTPVPPRLTHAPPHCAFQKKEIMSAGPPEEALMPSPRNVV